MLETAPNLDGDYLLKVYIFLNLSQKKYQKGYRSIGNRINVQNIGFQPNYAHSGPGWQAKYFWGNFFMLIFGFPNKKSILISLNIIDFLLSLFSRGNYMGFKPNLGKNAHSGPIWVAKKIFPIFFMTIFRFPIHFYPSSCPWSKQFFNFLDSGK